MAGNDGNGNYFGNGSLPRNPSADARSSNLLLEMERQIKDAKARGLSVRQILDPTSRHYIGPQLIAAHDGIPSDDFANISDAIRQRNPEVDTRPNPSVQLRLLNRPTQISRRGIELCG